jgi:hypothetical protein
MGFEWRRRARGQSDSSDLASEEYHVLIHRGVWSYGTKSKPDLLAPYWGLGERITSLLEEPLGLAFLGPNQTLPEWLPGMLPKFGSIGGTRAHRIGVALNSLVDWGRSDRYLTLI